MRQKRGKKVSRSKEARNDMEEKQEVRKVRRIFTPEQKFEILKDIQRCATIKEGLAKHQLAQSLYQKWKRQLEVGVRASLRNRRPLKTADLKRLEAENRKLKEVVLNQALLISELKKEMNLDERERAADGESKASGAGIGRIPSGGGAIGERGIGDCGGGAIELLPVEEGRGREKGRATQFI